MKLLTAIAFIAFLGYVGYVSGAAFKAPRFDGYKMYQVFIKTEEDLKQLKDMSDDIELNIQRDVYAAGRRIDIVIRPTDQQDFEARLHYYKIAYEIKITDLQRVIEGRRMPPKGLKAGSGMEWTQYHSLDDIYDWMDDMATRYKKYVSTQVIGYSYEGRPIRALKINKKSGKSRKTIFIDSNIHAIEWISSAAGTCFFDKLLSSSSKKLKSLVTNYDWVYVPVVNPDGFVYTHDVHPLWRKNRNPTGYRNSSGPCYGTDLNRNFDHHWKEAGFNVDVPCDHWYAGNAANSEPEIKALQKFIKSKPNTRIYLPLHSYGNFLLSPFGHTTNAHPPNYDQMMRISKGFADAARAKHGTVFNYGTSGELLYPVSGSAKDWVYDNMDVPFSATIELRDNGEQGFFLSADQIIPVCEELTEGIIGLVKAAVKEKIFKK